MGSLLTIMCPTCGYAETLGIGIGMRAIEVGAYRCNACHELSALPKTEPKRCEHCSRTDLSEWPLEEEAVETPCPECGARADVEPTGIWD